MTRYAIHGSRTELLASWGLGYGDAAITVAVLPATASSKDQLVLAESLSRLSHALWRCYTHPASAAPSTKANTEGWQRQQTRASFSTVLDAVRAPNLPIDSTLIVSYDPVEEAAHRVGRALHTISDPDLTTAVLADVEAELAAVEQAERGDLSDRARQAVLLTREDVSPVQVAAASQLLAQHPLGTDDLFLHYDPTAAAVAAAHWLTAAADVVSELSGLPVGRILEEADNIEALPYSTPTTVLEFIEDGMPPALVITSMIQEAMLIAEGELLLDSAAAEGIVTAHNAAARPGPPPPETVRLTALDPQRPARDLLEALLMGIRGCWLLYSEYYIAGTDTPDDATDDDMTDEIDSSFERAVRERAEADRDRLT